MNQLWAILLGKVLAFAGSTAMLYLAISAEVRTMPEKLPSSPSEIPQWVWGWQRSAAIAFLNMRHPETATPSTDKEKTQ